MQGAISSRIKAISSGKASRITTVNDVDEGIIPQGWLDQLGWACDHENAPCEFLLWV
jgi:hypothetical protein